jgi:hypothetical protein
MQETAKALVSENQNELPAARTLQVSLDRADNVIEGGPAFDLILSLHFPKALKWMPHPSRIWCMGSLGVFGLAVDFVFLSADVLVIRERHRSTPVSNLPI